MEDISILEQITIFISEYVRTYPIVAVTIFILIYISVLGVFLSTPGGRRVVNLTVQPFQSAVRLVARSLFYRDDEEKLERQIDQKIDEYLSRLIRVENELQKDTLQDHLTLIEKEIEEYLDQNLKSIIEKKIEGPSYPAVERIQQKS